MGMNYKHNVSICAMYRDEGSCIKEWLEYHILIGVRHFYLYNNLSKDNHKEVIEPYIKQGIVTYNEYKVDIGKCKKDMYMKDKDYPYRHCINNYKNESKWIGFIDLDEFIALYKNNNINKFMEEFTNYAGVAMHWKVFGSSGHYIEPKGMIIENYTLRSPNNYTVNKHVKSIVNPRLVQDWYNPHFPQVKNKIVRENGTQCMGAVDDVILHQRCAIHHYVRKSKWNCIFKRISKVWDITKFKTKNNGKDLNNTNSFGANFYANDTLWEPTNSFKNNCIDDTWMIKFCPYLHNKLSTSSCSLPLILDWKSYYNKPPVMNYVTTNINKFSGQSMSALFHYWFFFDNQDPSTVSLISLDKVKTGINISSYLNHDFLLFLKEYDTSATLSSITPKIIMKFYVDYELMLPPNFNWHKYRSLHPSISSLTKYQVIAHWTHIGRFSNLA